MSSKNKKVLLIGNPNSIYNITFIKSIKKQNANIEFDLFSTKHETNKNKYNVDLNTLYTKIYNPYEIKVFNKKIYIHSKLKYLRKYLFNKKIKKINQSYDYAHVQYIDYSISNNKFFINNLKKISNNIVATIWGSDFFAKSNSQLNKEKYFYDQLKFVAVATKFHADKIKTKFKVEIRTKAFGCKLFDDIDNDNQDKDHHAIFKIPKNKIVIVVGYNASSNQQHEKILDQIINSQFIKENKEKYHFIFPFTYSKKQPYYRHVKNRVKASGLSHTTLDKLLDFNSLISLRKISDVLIQLPKTDNISASMLETIYCGNLVITGSWLPYQFLKESNIHFHEIDRIEDVNAKLKFVLKNIDSEKEKVQPSKEILYSEFSVENIAEKWIQRYAED